MNRSLRALPPVSGCVTTQAEAIVVLRTALSDPEVSPAGLANVVKQVAGVMRHCRPEVYLPGTEPLRAEFVLLLAAARSVAFACEDLDECVHTLRMRAENEFEGYTFGLDCEIAKLCCDAMAHIIINRRYPSCGMRRKSDIPDMYWDACMRECARKILLGRLAEKEQRIDDAERSVEVAEETLALAS